MNLDDTIVAIATPPGRGGIGVVRLAGPEARSIASPMLRLRHALAPNRAVFGELMEPGELFESCDHSQPSEGESTSAEPIHLREGENETVSANSDRIDEVVVTYFAKPYSYTTDDIIEISAHGSPVVLRRMVELSLARGARMAEPGEFTMRAFLNGRLDLTQAEAVRDLIDAQTLFQAKVAAQQLDGALSHRLKPIKQKLIEVIAMLEAGIDFAEDDVAVASESTVLARIAEIKTPLHLLARTFSYGKLVRQGLTLAIVGRPNVGKSSLFNRLVERERAIVTAQPGTTRDLVSETISIGGIPVELVDTAGIRDAFDEAESLGIKKSIEALAEADLVLLVVDASQPPHQQDEQLRAQLASRCAIVVENKSDLITSPLSGALSYRPGPGPASEAEGSGIVNLRIPTSALTGEGIRALREAILNQVSGNAPQQEAGFLTNLRHKKLVEDSLAALDAAANATHSRVPHEMLLLDLYSALRALDEITGVTSTDDILNLIFGTFCIGK
jgi:tRNA modification GTPase